MARLPEPDISAAPSGPPSPYRWLVLLGLWLVYVTFGTTMASLAPLVEPITRDLGIGHGSMGFVFGVWQIAHADKSGWWLVGGGIAMLVADVLIDFVWAHPSISKSDQPDLNRRADQLVGRVLLLEEAIEAGRGKVRVGDTLWLAEGADLPAGTRVKVTGVRRDALLVEQV